MLNKLWRPAIEFNLTQHCNLRCEHCDHASSRLPKKFADLEGFRRDVEVMSTVLEANEFKFVGGEPLLHPQLLEFVRIAKESGIGRRLVLVTNGVLLHRAPDELWNPIDGMWISLYPGIKYRFDWDWVQKLTDDHSIFVWRKETPEFVESSLVEEIQDPEFVKMIYANCDRAHLYSCATIFDGRYFVCEPAVWANDRLALHGIALDNKDADSVAIHNNPNLYDQIDALIRQEEPLEACSYCLGSWARRTPNRQLSRKDIQTFLTRKPDLLGDLVNEEWIVPSQYTKRAAQSSGPGLGRTGGSK
jgi:organic radical activating enzyme